MILEANYSLGRRGIPLVVTLGFWAIMLFVYAVTPILYTPINSEAFLFTMSCFLAFYMGYRAIPFGGYYKQMAYRISKKRLTVILFFLICIYIISIYLHSKLIFLKVGSFIEIINSPFLIREANLARELQRPYLLVLFEFFTIPGVYLGLIILFFDKKRMHKLLAIIPILAMFVIQLFSLSRGLIITSVLLALTLYWLSFPFTYKQKIKNTILIVLVALTILQSIFVLRPRIGQAVSYAEKIISYHSWFPKSIQENEFFLSVVTVLHYSECGIYGFAHYTKSGLPGSKYLLGEHSLNGILKIIGPILGKDPKQYFDAIYSYDVVESPTYTVVFSFFRQLYDDFGVVGTVSIHFLWGMILGITYRKYCRYRSLKDLVIPVYLCYWYIYGIFIMQTVFVSSFAYPVITYCFVGFVEKRVKRPPSSPSID